jgi:hypothetical protein
VFYFKGIVLKHETDDCNQQVYVFLLVEDLERMSFSNKQEKISECKPSISCVYQNIHTLLKGITDNGINRLMESNSKVPNYSFIPKVGWASFLYCYHLVNGISYGVAQSDSIYCGSYYKECYWIDHLKVRFFCLECNQTFLSN